MWAPPVSHLLICVLGRQQDILWLILARNEGNSVISSLLASGRVVCVSSRVQQESAGKTLKSLTGVRCTHSTRAAEKHGLWFWFQMELTVSLQESHSAKLPHPLDVWEKATCRGQETRGLLAHSTRDLEVNSSCWNASGRSTGNKMGRNKRTNSEVVK